MMVEPLAIKNPETPDANNSFDAQLNKSSLSRKTKESLGCVPKEESARGSTKQELRKSN
jgi:hypothetical protein